MGMSKNLMIAKYPEVEDEAEEMQADDWLRITSLGLNLPEPEDYQRTAVPF